MKHYRLLCADIVLGLLLLCLCCARRDEIERKWVDAANIEESNYEDSTKKIALTFDDGPHPYYTEQLLEGFRERGVHATFFVTGEHAKLHPDIIMQMHEDGHLIGNHTYSHLQLRADNQESFQEELLTTSELVEEMIGEEVIFVRPPYGSWNKEYEKKLNMLPVLWTIDTLDWSTQNVTSIVKKVLAKVGEDDIILMHDYYETSVTAALQVVDLLQEQGYEFVTVDELLLD